MRKNSLSAAIAAAAGIVGFILRKIEISTVLHNGVGIAEEHMPVTIALAVLSVAVAIFAAVYAFKIAKNTGSIAGETPGAMVMLFGALLVLFGAGLYYFNNKENLTPMAIVFSVTAVICAVSFWFTARPTDDEGELTKIMCVIPSVFCCLWLVLVYKENSSEPQIIKFVYKCLAIASITMSYYYSSGYFYGRKKPAPVTFWSILAIYFSIVTLSEAGQLWRALMLAGFAVTVCVSLVRLLGSMETI